MDESWTRAKAVFATLAGPPVVWLVAFFLVPMAIIWAYSFGENKNLVEIAIDGTFSNYVHALNAALPGHHSEVGLVRGDHHGAVPGGRLPGRGGDHLRFRADQGLAAAADHAAVLDQPA